MFVLFVYAVTGSSSGLLLNILSLLEAVEAAAEAVDAEEGVGDEDGEAVVDEVTEAEVVVVACPLGEPTGVASPAGDATSPAWGEQSAVAEVKLAEVKLAATAAAAADNCSVASAEADLRLAHEAVEYGEDRASRRARRLALRSSMILRNCSIFSRVTWSWSSTEGCRFQSVSPAATLASAAEATAAAEAVPRLPDATDVELVSEKTQETDI